MWQVYCYPNLRRVAQHLKDVLSKSGLLTETFRRSQLIVCKGCLLSSYRSQGLRTQLSDKTRRQSLAANLPYKSRPCQSQRSAARRDDWLKIWVRSRQAIWVVYRVVSGLPADLVTLAHEGAKAYSDNFELVHRREASGPNAIWQADHTPLDILLLRPDGEAAKPWLSIVIDDYSRGVQLPALPLEQETVAAITASRAETSDC